MIGQIWSAIATLFSIGVLLLVIGVLIIIVGGGLCLIWEVYKDIFRR